MSVVLNLIRRLNDERKTGRTFSIFLVLLLTLQSLDDAIPGVELGTSADLIAGALTPVVEFAWRKIRAAAGIERVGVIV